AWVDAAKRGALDQEHLIARIVSSPPPSDPVDADFIDHSLDSISTTRFFTRHAKSIDWLKWVENKPAFLELFSTNEKVSPISIELARWFADRFVCQHPNSALAVVQRKGPVLNSFLWSDIVQELAFSNPEPSAKTIEQWLTVLLRSPQREHPTVLLNELLHKCRTLEHKIAALLLFEYLTRPYIALRPSWRWLMNNDDEKKEQVEAEIVCDGNLHQLRESWSVVFLPQISDFVGQLIPVLTSHLMRAHQLLCAFEKADERWDSLSFRRAAIETHEQNRHPYDFDFVIDATRDVIDWLLSHEPQRARTIIEEWSITKVPLLKRLAVHGISEDRELPSNEKLLWILKKGWLFSSGMKHEVFRLLQKAYPDADQSVRVQLLDIVESSVDNQTNDD
ncbi:hypothetical protein L0244_36605, partial [bacterium]|nr:hypothetical protein [bacterium]